MIDMMQGCNMSDFPMLQLCKKLGSFPGDDAKLKHSLGIHWQSMVWRE